MQEDSAGPIEDAALTLGQTVFGVVAIGTIAMTLAIIGWPDARRLLWTQEAAALAASDVLGKVDAHVERLREEWTASYHPDGYFDELKEAIFAFADACEPMFDVTMAKVQARRAIQRATEELIPKYEEREPGKKSAVQKSKASKGSVDDLFRDLDR